MGVNFHELREGISSLEVNNLKAIQEVPLFIWNRRAHFKVHNSNRKWKRFSS